MGIGSGGYLKMEKMKMWKIEVNAEKDGDIGKDIEVFFKGKKVNSITDLRMVMYDMKGEGNQLLIGNCEERKI